MKPDDTDFRPAFGYPIAGWHRWWAWRPVDTIDRGVVWLRPVWRRRCQPKMHLPGPTSSWFQHVVGG